MCSSPAELSRILAIPDELAALEAQIAQLSSRQLELVAELDRTLPRIDFPDAAREEVAVACKISPGAAQQRLETARMLFGGVGLEPRLPATAEALTAGEIGFAHAHRMSLAVAGLDTDAARWVEIQVLGDERARTPGQVAHRARKAALKVGADRDERAAREAARRELHAWEFDGRVSFTWSMPAVDAALVQTWVDAAARKEGSDDLRLGAERRGDALFGLVRDALADADPGPAGRPGPARLDVLVTHESLVGAGWLADDVGAGGRCGGGWRRDEGNRLDGRSAFGEHVRQLGCDGEVRTTLVDRDGCILDQGRMTRVVSTRLRGLIDVRDQHCRFVGCEVPARRCDAHHVEHWADGGSTDLHNLILLCGRHHRAVHGGGWLLDLHADGAIIWESPTGQLVRNRAELDTLRLAPPCASPDDDHPPGEWIRPSWDFFREPPPDTGSCPESCPESPLKSSEPPEPPAAQAFSDRPPF